MPASLINLSFHKLNISGNHTVALRMPKNRKMVTKVMPGQLASARPATSNASMPILLVRTLRSLALSKSSLMGCSMLSMSCPNRLPMLLSWLSSTDTNPANSMNMNTMAAQLGSKLPTVSTFT